MHFGGLSLEVLEELIAVFSHGQADRMTSSVSTFLYTAEECAKFLELLRNTRSNISDGNTTCFVARLWSFVVGNRVHTHYGQRQTRLSRDQAILSEPCSERHWSYDVVSRLLFAVPGFYLSQLDDIYVDALVYADQWQGFMITCRDDWKLSLSWAFPLLISNILLFLAPTVSPAIAIATIILCSISILSGMLLLTRHEGLADASTSVAAEYLLSARSTTFGFHWASLLFSLPKALSLWSAVLFLFHCAFIAARFAGLNTNARAVGPAALIFLVVVVFWRYTPRDLIPRFTSRFSSDTTDADKSLV
jgi:hypothetical protein